MDLVQLRDDLEKGVMICKLKWLELVDFAEKQAADLKQIRGALLQPIAEMGELQTALERIAALEAELKERMPVVLADDNEPVATVSRNSDDTLTFTTLRDFYVINGMPLFASPPAAQPPAVQAGQWVSVDERLPEPFDPVLLSIRIEYINAPAEQSVHPGAYQGHGCWGGVLEPTHWMPYPPPPVAEQAPQDERITTQVAAWRAEVARLNDLIAYATGAEQAQEGDGHGV